MIFMEERDGTLGRTLDYRALEPESCGAKVSLQASDLIWWPLFFCFRASRATVVLLCVFKHARCCIFFFFAFLKFLLFSCVFFFSSIFSFQMPFTGAK